MITGKSKFSIGQYIALIPLGLSPYFLECISYKYDSVYMALSILASIAPLLFRFQKKYFVASVLGILIVCTTYQAASGIFPMLVIFLATRSWMKGENREEILRFVVISAIGYIAGLVLFKGFIMKPVDTYVDISVISTNNIIINTFANYKHYFELVRSDFKAEWIIIIYLMVLFCIVSFLKDTKRNKVATLLGGIICLILMMCTVFGVYPILTEPSFEPRAMYGVGVFISCMAVQIMSTEIKKSLLIDIGRLNCVLLSWAFFVFAFTYGNALYVQKEYTDFRISLVIDDINDSDILMTDVDKKIYFEGTIGYCPVIQNMPQDYQMLNRLVPITFRGDWHWGRYGFLNYYSMKNIYYDLEDDNSIYDIKTRNMPILKETVYHTIRGDSRNILIELK